MTPGSKHIENEILVFSESGGRITAHLTFDSPENVKIVTREGAELAAGRDYRLVGREIELCDRSVFYFQEGWLQNRNVPPEIPSENLTYGIEGCLLVGPEFMRQAQLLASYDCAPAVFPDAVSDRLRLPVTYRKLTEKKRLKLALFGDSISNAANSSWEMGWTGEEHWCVEAVWRCEERYGARIEFYNCSRSGYGTVWALDAAEEKFAGQNVDLAIIAFGMNDAPDGMTVETFTANISKIMEKIRACDGETEFILMAPFLPNPDCVYVNKEQKNYLFGLKTLEREGVTVLDMTSVFRWLLERKSYCEISGNNLNHPNDFGYSFFTDALSRLFARLKTKTENRLDWSEYFEAPDFERADLPRLPANIVGGYLRTRVNGTEKKTFAYFGRPAGAKGLCPAVVLAHGAGGNAFLEWVESWTRRGYLAMAVDLNGTHFTAADPIHPQKNSAAGDICVGSFDSLGKDPYASWTYYGVAQLISAHSYLLSLPDTDPERTGIVGISWGGVLSLMAIGADRRFSAAAIIYSAGFITDDLLGQETGLFDTAEKKNFYDTWLDPQNYLDSADLPVLFHAGLLDGAFSPFNRRRTCRLLAGEVSLAVKKELYHDNVSNFENKNVFAFFDDRFFGGERRRKPLEAELTDAGLRLGFVGVPTAAELIYTETVEGDLHKLPWKSLPIRFSDGKATVPIPERAKVVTAVVYYGDGLYTSCDLIDVDKIWR